MKKILFFLLFTATCSSVLFAENESPFACSFEDVSWLQEGGDRYFLLPYGNDKATLSVGDAKSVLIDKKNKIVKIWVNLIWSKEEKKSYIVEREKTLSSLGFSTWYIEFDLKNNQYRFLEGLDKTCNREIIRSEKATKNNWENIYPDTVNAQVAEILKQRYSL